MDSPKNRQWPDARPDAQPGTDLLASLDSLEISTGHIQREQVSDAGALAESVRAIPDHLAAATDPDAPTPCAFVTGIAGSGKSYTLRQRCESDPSYAVLCSSTGISAVNLNTVTVNSLLGYFDTNSLRDAYIQGSVQRRLRKLAEEGYRNVAIDECSMISRDVLDLLVRAFDDVNQHFLQEGKPTVGLILCGDYCQLAPIADEPKHVSAGSGGRRRRAAPVPWAFESQFWERFAANETRLTKVWRQADPRFLAALNFARSGRGRDCMQVLQSVSQRFEQAVDHEFDGTTIVGKNDEVDRLNQIRLDKVKGRLIALPSRRWAAGRSGGRKEWKLIPERTLIRENCYVMILANRYEGRDLIYANGDCGWVRGVQPGEGGTLPAVLVELARNGEVVAVPILQRAVDWREKPENLLAGDWPTQAGEEDGKYRAEPHYRKEKRRWITGQIEYYPLRVAYASTVHRSQGLSLDRVQVDYRGWMFRGSAMLYVAMSRARTLAGLRLVGTPELLVDRCRVDDKVRRWL